MDEQDAKDEESLLKTANKVVTTSQIFVLIFAIFSGILGAMGMYFYVTYDNGLIATCDEGSMEITCSNVVCNEDKAQFGDCQVDFLLFVNMLIGNSLSEFCYFFWARCFRDCKCMCDSDMNSNTPLARRESQIMTFDEKLLK